LSDEIKQLVIHPDTVRSMAGYSLEERVALMR